MTGQMVQQLFRQAFGVDGLRPVPLEAASQQSGFMTDTIDSEDEVHDRAGQGHQPDETHPRDGCPGITLVKNHMPSRQHREEQTKAQGGDMPDVVHQIIHVHRHVAYFFRGEP